MSRRQKRQALRTLRLGQALDSSLLREKELQQRQEQLAHRLQEMAASQAYRLALPLALPPETPEPQTHLDRLLAMKQE